MKPPRGGLFYLMLALALLGAGAVEAHGVSGKDAAFVASAAGPRPLIFAYLGAKHMVTGYDHLLFLAGVVFFLRRLKDVALYVSLFSLGHSITLLCGVLLGLRVDPFLVDAVIGLSVSYKAFDNLGGWTSLGLCRPDPRAAVLVLGLVHGLGLATKLQALALSPRGLAINLVGFNLGVEAGQLAALALIWGLVAAWRRREDFPRQAVAANGVLMSAGFVIVLQQLTLALGGPKP